MVQWQKWKGFLILWWHRNDCQPKGRTSLWLRRMGKSPPSMCGDPPAWYLSNTLFHQITFLINVATHPFNTLTPTNLEARDLEVNGGVWRGETTDVGYDTFPSGWGILQYNEADHLNRFWSNWDFQRGRWTGRSTTGQWLWEWWRVMATSSGRMDPTTQARWKISS